MERIWVLPSQWHWTLSSLVCASVRDGTHDTPKYVKVGVPLVTSKNLVDGKIDFKNTKSISIEDHNEIEKRSAVHSGDILIAMIGTIGNPVVVDKSAEFSIKNVGLFKKNEIVINSFYLKYWLGSRSFMDWLEPRLRGTTQKFAPLGLLRSLPVPLPPINEQQRIVAKIEELFSGLDAGVESLKTAQAQLKVYRQALLKHAFEGKLTEQWRAENSDSLETADELLARIKQERKSRHELQMKEWEVAVKRWEVGGQEGKKPRKPKNSVLLEMIAEKEYQQLPELPLQWLYIRFGEIIDDIDAGKSFRCDEREPSESEVGVAKVSAVSWGEYDQSESKTCLDLEKVVHEYFIREGDFIISRANTIELVGAAVVVRGVSKSIMLSDKTLRLLMDDKFKVYTLHYLRSRTGRKQIMSRSTGNQDSMRNIGQDRIKSICFPICSKAEMSQITELLDVKLSIVDRKIQTLESELRKAEALRHSILKKAFSGQLVPQDPNDEPASVLLDRIVKEEQENITAAKAKKKTAKKKLTARKTG